MILLAICGLVKTPSKWVKYLSRLKIDVRSFFSQNKFIVSTVQSSKLLFSVIHIPTIINVIA